MPIQKIKSKILEIKYLTKDTKKFVISVPRDFSFKAGQYILLEIQIKGKIQRRAYSIASEPNMKNIIELCIKKIVREGFVSELFKLKTNSKITFIGPAGKFFINEIPKNNLVFISVGTGIAPFKSMVEYLLKELKFKKQITLIHGYRHEKDILYKNEFEELEKQFKNFKQKIILSKPKEQTKKILKGHVQEFIKDIETKNTKFYICGMKEMVSESILKLKSLKVKSENILFEKYD